MRHVCPECGSGDEAGTCPADAVVRVPAGADGLLGTTIGSWRVARMLGAGGMGRVYVAVQPQIGARVAIKVLKQESAAAPDVVERFFNEARAVNLIKHENIVDVIDLGRLPDGSPYIVMEYLDGASLGTILRREKRLALGTLARLVGEVLAALDAAHAKGIVHRDLKPDNVFVSPSGRVTVLDFGIAKLVTANALSATQTGSLLGTPAYMSPEQARSQPLDARADLYSVGVMLYEGATGTLPFTAANLFDLLQQHVAAVPRPPRSRNPEIPEALEQVILRALEKDPVRRFASAAEMRRALETATSGLPQLALSSLAFGDPEAWRKRSDPFAATAATTQESLARGETVASSPPPLVAVQKSVQLSRKALVGLLAGAALVGLGAAAVVVMMGPQRQPEPQTAPQPQPQLQPQLQPQPQPQPQLQPQPQPQQPAPQPQPQPAQPQTSSEPPNQQQRAKQAQPKQPKQTPPDPVPNQLEPRPAPNQLEPRPAPNQLEPRPAPNQLEPKQPPARKQAARQPPASADEPPTYRKLELPNLRAFDPYAFYARAVKEATALGGSVYPTMIRWRKVDRAGKLDVLDGGSAGYDFASRDKIKSGEPDCVVSVMIEPEKAGGTRASRGTYTRPEACKEQRGIRPPTCSVPQLWEKAIAKGAPATAKYATFSHNYVAGWVFSTDDGFSTDLDDDCR